jgi:hypothetical protein
VFDRSTTLVYSQVKLVFLSPEVDSSAVVIERERFIIITFMVFFALNGILRVPVVFLLWGILKDLRQF